MSKQTNEQIGEWINYSKKEDYMRSNTNKKKKNDEERKKIINKRNLTTNCNICVDILSYPPFRGITKVLLNIIKANTTIHIYLWKDKNVLSPDSAVI